MLQRAYPGWLAARSLGGGVVAPVVTTLPSGRQAIRLSASALY